MFIMARMFSVNHISRGSPGAIILIVLRTTPLSVVIKITFELWQSFAMVTIFNQQDEFIRPLTQYRRPLESANSTCKYFH